MRVCYFDDVVGGHHNGYVGGLLEETLRTGHVVLAACPERPKSPEIQWLHASRADTDQIWQSRRQLRAVVDSCIAQRVDTFIDLNLDRNVWLLPRILGDLKRRIHVLHHVDQYSTAGRTAHRKGPALYLRTYLRYLAKRGDVIVVHTSQAKRFLGQIIPPKAILQLPYPVRAPTMPDAFAPKTGSDIPTVLFVGQARQEKGLPDLLAATQQLHRAAVIRVVGPQRQDVKRQLATQFSSVSIDWIDDYVSEAELSGHIETSSLIAAPYRNSFAKGGGASGVLLDALAHGKPLLITDALGDQLPVGYSGAVVTRADEPESLAKGLDYSLANLAVLARNAGIEGPAYIARRHSFTSYVAELLNVSNTGISNDVAV